MFGNNTSEQSNNMLLLLEIQEKENEIKHLNDDLKENERLYELAKKEETRLVSIIVGCPIFMVITLIITVFFNVFFVYLLEDIGLAIIFAVIGMLGFLLEFIIWCIKIIIHTFSKYKALGIIPLLFPFTVFIFWIIFWFHWGKNQKYIKRLFDEKYEMKKSIREREDRIDRIKRYWRAN